MIHLVATFGLSHFSWIPQFINHYKDLGVERFWLTLHADSDQQDQTPTDVRYQDAQRIIADMGIETLPFLIGKFTGRLLRERHDFIQSKYFAADDWVIWSDADEFQVYPQPIKALFQRFDKEGANAIGGTLVDRTTEKGELNAFDPQYQIWAQYPIACNITGDILGGNTRKVAAAKANVAISYGNHELSQINQTPVVWAPEIVAIYHFKWDETVLVRLAPRLDEDWKRLRPWWIETQRFVDHVSTHGHIDLKGLETYNFGDGFHQQADIAAWNFVRRLSESSKSGSVSQKMAADMSIKKRPLKRLQDKLMKIASRLR